MMTNRTCITTLSGLLLAFALGGTVHAQTPAGSVETDVPTCTMRVVIKANAAQIPIELRPGKLTVIQFPETGIKTNDLKRGIKIGYDSSTVLATPTGGKISGNIVVKTDSGKSIILEPIVSASNKCHAYAVEYEDRDQALLAMRAERDECKANLATLVKPQRTTLAADQRNYAVSGTGQRVDDGFWADVLNNDGAQVIPIDDLPSHPDDALVTYHMRWIKKHDTRHLYFTLHNREETPYPLASLQLRSEHSGLDHAGFVVVEMMRYEQGSALDAVIPAHEAVKVYMEMTSIEAAGTSLMLMMSEPDGTRPVMKPIPVIDLTPTETPRERLGKQAILSARVLGGAIWLADGLGQDKLDATTVVGGGARITKGITPLVGFEAEILFGKTGEAAFEGMTIDNMPGTLTRSATLGRMHFGGVLRFGDKVIPTFRAGVGVQIANYGADFSMGDADGGDGLGVDGLAYFGAGVDVRIGKDLIVGMAANYESMRKDDGQGIQFGLHVGYGWSP